MEYGVTFKELTFWVVHRSVTYGPFDYQFSIDLDGIEMLYQGDKFGECCGEDQFFADLKSYKIPITVSEVATVVMGAIIFGIYHGESEQQRHEHIYQRLCDAKMPRYAKGLKFQF